MPQFAHGFVGLGAAAAWPGLPQGPALRKAWPGTLLLLTYLPDVLDWWLHLARAGTPHGAMCSLPVTLLLGVAVTAVLRGVFGERRPAVHVLALTALASHLVLDLYSGGIPLWWPFSSQISGSDPLGLEELSFRPRVAAELALFSPLLSLGLLASGMRSRRHPAALVSAGGLFGMSVCGALARDVFLAATSVLGLGIFWLRSGRVGLRLPSAWNLLAAAPVLLLAGVQVHGWSRVQLGLLAQRRGEYETAIAHYRRAAFLRPLGLDGVELYRVGRAYLALGRAEEARALFEQGLREYPGRLLFFDGLVHLYLAREDARYYNPDEALRLARIVHARATKGYYRAYAADLVRMAEQAVRERGGSP